MNEKRRACGYPEGPVFYFFYRDGSSGNGLLCVNRYDVKNKIWNIVAHPLVDGENKCNPYWWRPAIGADGTIHLEWCWRDTPDAETNHDICYVRSNGGGKTWVRSDGTRQALPITQEKLHVRGLWKNNTLVATNIVTVRPTASAP